MNTEASKLKHLEFIQQNITRLADQSFRVKGWAVLLSSALLALVLRFGPESAPRAAAALPVFFWLIDSYYLKQERAFRKLYDVKRGLTFEETDFSLGCDSRHLTMLSWCKAFFSVTLVITYSALICSLLAARCFGPL